MAYRTYLPTTQSVRHVKSPREQGNSIMFTVDDDALALNAACPVALPAPSPRRVAELIAFGLSRHRDIDSELRLVAALRRAARERGGPLPSIDVADALPDERRELTGGLLLRLNLA